MRPRAWFRHEGPLGYQPPDLTLGPRGGWKRSRKTPFESAPQSFGAPASARVWLEYTAYCVASFSDKVVSAGGMKPDTQALPQCSMLLIGLRSSACPSMRNVLLKTALIFQSYLSLPTRT